MKPSTHPLWLAGFRPFFGLACLSGLSLPILWMLLFTGVIEAPQISFSIRQWHAHEMFFGFGWAILGGFLLTATKNWVEVRGYLAIIAQLAIDFLNSIAHHDWGGAVSIHAFTFGAMGLIIPAMVIRISKGHTGRKVVFDSTDKAALWAMMLAFVLRVVAPQIYPDGYIQWLYLAAACWFACFALLAWRYFPFLLQPRIDGKAH